ncbi:MAG: hypothetical protein ACOX8R_05200 [Bacillota bacterium]|jgi:hypothetical protein
MISELWVQITAYAVSVGCLYGALSTRLKELEKKVDVHNHLVERMYRAEMKINLLEEKFDDATRYEE